MEIQKARLIDIPNIHELIAINAQKSLMLPRALSELYDHLRDYSVAKDQGSVVGVIGLGICWEDLAEIKSLAVAESYKKKGLGSALVRWCLEEARELGVKKVFALTYVPEFFKRLGFSEIGKEGLPHKIWADCVKCPRFPNCDEVAVIYYL